MTKKIKVIYIVGCGRSGSTLLDTILGNNINIESVGELTNLVKSGWINNEYCACGKRGQDCVFWAEVKKQWIQKNRIDNLEDYLLLQNSFEKLRNLPKLLINKTKPSSDFKRYIEQTYSLFESIKTVSKKSIIVDSSKSPIRALALSAIPEIDLYLIHLVRDGRGVAWSLQKSYKKNEKGGVQKDLKSRPIWRTALFWSLSNLLSEFTINQNNNNQSIQICYEDLISSPQKTLKNIGNVIQVDFSQVIEYLINQKPINVSHTIAGNRLRMKGNITLKPDTEWLTTMSETEKNLFWSIAGLLMSRYGYKKQVSNLLNQDSGL